MRLSASIFRQLHRFYSRTTYKYGFSNYGSVWTLSAIDSTHCITEESLCSPNTTLTIPMRAVTVMRQMLQLT